jgi:metal-dependent amidase/aminoacylase/carboxypeptidase family protein
MVADVAQGAEDFAFYADAIPSAFFFLGQANQTLQTDASLHNRRFQLDESVMATGAAPSTALALEALKVHQD